MTEKLGTILLADDDSNDVELILKSFVDGKILNPVVAANNGAEALDYLYRRGRFATRGEDPKVLLLDIKIPKVDGLEVLRQIRSDPRLKLTPVVMLSSSTSEADLERSYELGANAYVVKPADFDEFVRAVAIVGSFWGVINSRPTTLLHTAAAAKQECN